jgi:hypothetical protein
MSDRPLRVSRRRLLQITGLAPLAALAAKGASTEELTAEAARVGAIPNDVMADLIAKAGITESVKQQRFTLIVNVLWTYWLAGARDAGLLEPVPPAELRDFLVDVAYGQRNKGQLRSGDLIRDRLGWWDDLAHHAPTNVCAFRCGYYAAEIVLDSQRGKVDASVYQQAFRRTEREMTMMMNHVRSLQAARGKEPAAEFLGGGC